MFEKEITTCPRYGRETTITHYFEEVNNSKLDTYHSCSISSAIKCDGTEDGINKCHLIKNY